MTLIRYLWLICCAVAVVAGAVASTIAASTRPFVPFTPMASSDLYLSDRPGVSSASLEQLVRRERVVMVGAASDPGATQRLFLLSYLAIPVPLPGVTCREANPGNPALVIASPGPLPTSAHYDTWKPPTTAHVTAVVSSPTWVAASDLTPTTWQSYCLP